MMACFNFWKLGYEIRSTSVHEQMLEMWKRNFEVKLVPNSKVQFSFSNTMYKIQIPDHIHVYCMCFATEIPGSYENAVYIINCYCVWTVDSMLV